jgi:methylthioribose-1-phosphate isomerase
MNKVPSPIIWKDDKLHLLDQRLIPNEEVYVICSTITDAHNAIKDMVVRGAPCIGFTAIYGLALWVSKQDKFSLDSFKKAASGLKEARPTAVNLMFEIDRIVHDVENKFNDTTAVKEIMNHVLSDGHFQIEKSLEKNTLMAQFAVKELKKIYPDRKLNLMTHCNTGFLACGTLGTALGVISHAFQENLVEMVYADETRPYMQGTRLTAYELSKEAIPYKIVVEGAASYLLSNGLVDAIFVGADRIAANGDTANKVGTSTLAIVAKYYNIPFFVVAPLSSFDFNTPSGKTIEIELRDENEIISFKEHRVAPLGARALNPSFDVTTSDLITGIICEKGVVLNPTTESMKILNR